MASNSVAGLTKRGRKIKPIVASAAQTIGNPNKFYGLANWVLRFEDSAGKTTNLSWKWAASRPQLGRLFLDNIYDLTESGGPIGSVHTARSWHNSSKFFFEWLNDVDSDGDIGANRQLALWMFAAYKNYVDELASKEKIKSIVGYHRKRVVTRILQRIHCKDPRQLEGDWEASVFALDPKVDDGKARIPYSTNEANRILDTISKFLRDNLSKDSLTSSIPAPWRLDSLRERMLFTGIGLTLGIEPECVTGLRVENITEVQNKVRVRYLKTRVPSDPHRIKQASAANWGETVVACETFKTAGGLLAYAKRLAADRGVTSEGSLWSKSYEQNEFDKLSSYLYKYYGLRSDDGQKLRIIRARFRVTWKSTRLLKSNGNLALTTEDHTKDVGAKHYLENEFLIPLYEQTIVNAAQAALAHAIVPKIKVMDLAENASAEEVSAAAERINEPPEQVRRALSGETDVWLASCKNFFNSPWDQPGEPCSKSFWACFDCQNALVTRRVLPRVLRYLDHVIDQRKVLADVDWAKKFGRAHAQITEVILPSFTSSVIDEARVISEGLQGRSHVPPELLT